jgi:hypothetical protein
MSEQKSEAEAIAKLVRAEVDAFPDEALRERLATFLVTPHVQILRWEKPPHQELRCWIVADFQVGGFQGRGVGVAYCEQAHGENGYFWNLVFLRGQESLDWGNNSCYRTLAELAVDSGYCD